MTKGKQKRPQAPDLPPHVIARALDGDRVASRQFYKAYDPTVRWAVAMRVRRWPELVTRFEDLVQEVWLELLRNGGKRLRYYKGDRGLSFRGFLGFIAARHGWRRARVVLARDERDAMVVEGMGTEADEQDALDLVQRLIEADLFDQLSERVDAELDEVDQRIFRDHFVNGETLRAIAKDLGIKEPTVQQRKRRIYDKLRTLVGELLGEPITTSPEQVAMVLATLYALAQGFAEGLNGFGGGGS